MARDDYDLIVTGAGFAGLSCAQRAAVRGLRTLILERKPWPGTRVHTTGILVKELAEQWTVRRLTPRECERLQGFPADFTAIPWRGKPASECPDGPRYKALGNSMAVNCMRWIGLRIEMVEEIMAELDREAAE